MADIFLRTLHGADPWLRVTTVADLTGTSASGWKFSQAAAGKETQTGTSAAGFKFSQAAAGEIIFGAKSSFGWSQAATGAELVTGTSASGFKFSSLETAAEGITGTSASAFKFAVSSTAVESFTSTAASSFKYSTVAAGAQSFLGAAAQAWQWGQVADGGANSGTSAAGFKFNGVAAGLETLTGTSASGWQSSLVAAGTITEVGASASAWGWSPAGVVSVANPVTGTSASGWTFGHAGVISVANPIWGIAANVDLARLGTVTGSDGSLWANLIDGDDSTLGYVSYGGQNFELDLGQAQTITSFRVAEGRWNEQSEWILQSSTDNTNWTTRHTGPDYSHRATDRDTGVLDLPAPVTARYWKLQGIDWADDSVWEVRTWSLFWDVAANVGSSLAPSRFKWFNIPGSSGDPIGGTVGLTGAGGDTAFGWQTQGEGGDFDNGGAAHSSFGWSQAADGYYTLDVIRGEGATGFKFGSISSAAETLPGTGASVWRWKGPVAAGAETVYGTGSSAGGWNAKPLGLPFTIEQQGDAEDRIKDFFWPHRRDHLQR